MILIPRLLNRYSKDRPSWQELYDMRLALLKFAGIRFWKPEDFAFAGPLPPEIQLSVSAFPMGTAAAAAGSGGSDTLTLNSLAAFSTDDFLATAGVRFQRAGYVQELEDSVWTSQNPGTEWIDNNASTVGDDYEAKLDTTTGTTTFLGGWSENTYATINTTLTGQKSSSSGTQSCSGTAYVREITNTSNLVSASFSLQATVFGGGILL